MRKFSPSFSFCLAAVMIHFFTLAYAAVRLGDVNMRDVTVVVPSDLNGYASATAISNVNERINGLGAVTRVYNPTNGTEWTDGARRVWRVTYVPVTNIVCTLSNPFGRLAAPDMYDRPEQSVFVGAYGTQIDAGNSWFVSFDAANDGFYVVYNAFSGDTWSISGQNPPTVANPEDGALFGTAAFTYQVTYTASTSRVDTVALMSDLDALPKPSSDALRLASTNGTEWIDGAGGRWRITQQAVSNDNQLTMFNSSFDFFGIVTVNRVFALNEWSAIMGSDNLYYAGDVYQEGLFYVAVWNTENEQASYSMCLPSDLTTFPKTYNNPINGHTGWVDRVVLYQTVTSRVDTVAFVSEVAASKEFHADSFTNLIWRTVWSNGWCWAIAYTNTP